MPQTIFSDPSNATPGAVALQPYTDYQFSFTATQAQTFLTFQFRQDPDYWALDDVSVRSSGGTQLLANGGFENGLTGWTLIGQQGLSAGGAVVSGTPGTDQHSSHSGSEYFSDGAVGGLDGIYQAFATTVGQQYTLEFWLASGSATQSDPALALVEVGSDIYPTTPTNLALAPASDSGLGGDGITNATHPTITGAGAPGETITLSDGQTAIGTAIVAADGTWTVTPTVALTDGVHALTATATNANNDVSDASAAFDLTIDDTPPPISATLATTQSSGPAIDGVTDPNATVVVSDAGNILGTAIADLNGQWTFQTTGLTTGTHTLVASVTDVAGNASAASVDVVIQPPSTPTPATITSQTVNVVRFFDLNTGTHFYSDSNAETQQILDTRPDLQLESAQMGALDPATAATDPNAAPVFRFFDQLTGSHFFTANTTERDTVLATRSDLTFEGIGFYEHATPQPGDEAVYRFFDKTDGSHFYTVNAAEHASIAATRPDMIDEGIGFYAPKLAA